MAPTITAFAASPDRGQGLARDMRVRWALEEVGQTCEVRLLSFACMDSSALNQFAQRYTVAWCGQNAANVAAFFEEQGSLKINNGSPAIGRTAIAESVQSFMTAFPDIVVNMDRLDISGARMEYHWTLTGTHTGPGGTGRFVRVSGYEEWRFGSDGLILESLGHFDESNYRRQLNADGARP